MAALYQGAKIIDNRHPIRYFESNRDRVVEMTERQTGQLVIGFSGEAGQKDIYMIVNQPQDVAALRKEQWGPDEDDDEPLTEWQKRIAYDYIDREAWQQAAAESFFRVEKEA